MTEEYRQRTIRSKLARMELPSVHGVSTGLRALDGVLGPEGLPRGRLIEWFGPPSCGKTTLALQTVAHLQGRGLAAAWIDADRTFDPGYAAARGVALEKMPVARPETAEEALEIARQLLDSGAIDLLVLDSAAALAASLELDPGVGDGGHTLQARVFTSGLRRIDLVLRRRGASAIFLNQDRGNPDTGGEPGTSAGVPALKLYAAVRLALDSRGGRRLHLRTLRNSVAEARPDGLLERAAGGGFTDTL